MYIGTALQITIPGGVYPGAPGSHPNGAGRLQITATATIVTLGGSREEACDGSKSGLYLSSGGCGGVSGNLVWLIRFLRGSGS